MNKLLALGAALCLTFSATAFGCADDTVDAPRAAGPHASEYGTVTYWQVIDAPALEWDKCTDAASFRDGISAPTFSTNSYLMYKVNAGGATAAGQSCSTTGVSSCSDSGKTWNVSGSVLTRTDDPKLDPQSGYPCSMQTDTVWTVTDSGTTAKLEVALNFSLVPDTDADQAACDTLDTTIAAEGTNSMGLNGCKMTIPVNMSFYQSK